jgi:hypothetical protein
MANRMRPAWKILSIGVFSILRNGVQTECELELDMVFEAA